MLSILIPTYNYTIFPLVRKLWDQCMEQQIEFEILCQDDGSQSVYNIDNNVIVTLENVMPISDNFIATYLETIKNPEINVCYGGITYKKNRPEESHILRWVYGYKRESLSAENRLKKPYQSSLTSNLLISRAVFKENRFSAIITKYGYEDLVFFHDLKLKNIQIFG